MIARGGWLSVLAVEGTSTTVIAADGTALSCRSEGSGDHLVLVHGSAADARQWARVVPILAARFNVVAMDRRGRGGSGHLAPDHSLEIEYGDFAAVVRSLPGPVHLLGHSSGARFALHAAASLPGLASLILYEPPAPEALSDAVMAALDPLEQAGDRRGILRLFFVDAVGMADEDFALLERRPVWPLMLDNALTLPAEMRAVRGYRFDPADVAGIATPTLLLLGELSDAEVAAVANQVAAALPDATVVTLPGQGHGAMISAPELFAREVQRFIRALGS